MLHSENQLSDKRLLETTSDDQPEERFTSVVKAMETVPVQPERGGELTGQKKTTSQPQSEKKADPGNSRHDGMRLFKILCDEIGKTNSGQAMFLKRGEPVLEAEGQLSIFYSLENKNFYQFVNKPELIKAFQTVLLQITGKAIMVSIKLETENFNELDLVEKTLRIVNDDAVKIIRIDQDQEN